MSRKRKAAAEPRPTPDPTPNPASARKRINLALQGGGAHGAFTWGILDALLEDGDLDVAAVTATSAGTMNMLALAEGMRKGGRDGARAALEAFWRSISEARGPFSPVSLNAIRKAFDPFGLMRNASFQWFEILTNFASPYEFNPWNLNPLRDALLAAVDFEALRRDPPFELFVSATNVNSGRSRVFRTHEIGIDVALASACLPYLFQAVEIEGQSYWDGGYVSNPALWPLFYDHLPRDVLLCTINPGAREGTPKTSAEIMDRLNEVTFSSSLVAELRAIAFVQKLLDEDQIKSEARDNYRRILVHAVKADQALANLGVQTKFDTRWAFLTDLRDKGRAEYRAWAKDGVAAVGERGTVDLRREYLD